MATLEMEIPDEKIQELLRGDRGMAVLLEPILNQILQAEMTEHLKAEPGKQTSGRREYRNGTYERKLTTRVGTIELEVPRDREGTFQTALFQRYQRSEKALVLTLMQMVVQGVSTRRVKDITTELCGREFSKSTVSRLSEELDEQRLRESEMVGVIAELGRAAKRQEMATKSLNNELQELEQQLRQGTTELAGMGMGWIPIGSDMDIFVRRFPLLLGLLLSIAIIWVAYRRLTLARAVEVLSSEDVGEDSRRFLQLEYGTLPAFLSWPHSALTIVGLVWIGFAAVSAASSPLVSGGGAAASGLGGAIALVAALAYRLYVFRQVPDTDSLALQD